MICVVNIILQKKFIYKVLDLLWPIAAILRSYASDALEICPEVQMTEYAFWITTKKQIL